ncbi:MAG TPA: GNAT family protein [Thermoplasmata archaeon]|jgi:RimJ/RimL family protein N-acetyltransferase|nr:GNAT family protein [Thermoplasmata archaeon]
MTQITVRPYRPEDAVDLGATYYELYDERDAGELVGITLFSDRPSPEDEKSWYESQYARAQKGEMIYLVAEVDGHVVGSCTVGRVGPTENSEQAHVAELGILVRRRMRGRGVGSALLERTLEEARKKFEVVYLSVFTFNARAQRLYERFGFAVCGVLPRAMKRGGQYFDLVRMARVLERSSSPPVPTVKPL